MMNMSKNYTHTVLQHRTYLLEESLLLFFFLLSSDVHLVSALQVPSAGCHDKKWLTCIVLCAKMWDHGFSKTSSTDLCRLYSLDHIPAAPFLYGPH